MTIQCTKRNVISKKNYCRSMYKVNNSLHKYTLFYVNVISFAFKHIYFRVNYIMKKKIKSDLMFSI